MVKPEERVLPSYKKRLEDAKDLNWVGAAGGLVLFIALGILAKVITNLSF